MILSSILYVNWDLDSKTSTFIDLNQQLFIILAIFDQKVPFLPIFRISKIGPFNQVFDDRGLGGLLYVTLGTDSKYTTLIDPLKDIFCVLIKMTLFYLYMYIFWKNAIDYQKKVYFSWF